MNSKLKRGFVFLLILLAIGAILYSYRSDVQIEEKTITEIAQALKQNNQLKARLLEASTLEERLQIQGQIVRRIKVMGDRLTVYFADGSIATAQKESNSSAKAELLHLGVTTEQLASIEWENIPLRDWTNWIALLGYILPALFVVGIIWTVLNRTKSPNTVLTYVQVVGQTTPEGQENKSFPIALSSDLYRKAQLKAASTGTPLAEVIRESLEQWVSDTSNFSDS